jgi:hypothetical protein
MTTQQKIQTVKAKMPGISDAEALKWVNEVDYLAKYDTVLRIMHQKCKIETGTNMGLMEFKVWIMDNAPDLPGKFEQDKIINN